MGKKFYAIVCRCDGKNLKAFENLEYYEMLARKKRKNKKKLFRQ